LAGSLAASFAGAFTGAFTGGQFDAAGVIGPIGVIRRSSPSGVVSASFIGSEDFFDPASDPPSDPEFLAFDPTGRSTTAQITGFCTDPSESNLMYWPSKLQVPLWLALERSAGSFLGGELAEAGLDSS